MRHLFSILLILMTQTAVAQIRAFDNSKSHMPWLYNPAANFTSDYQVYFGYDGRGKNGYIAKSIVGGVRAPMYFGNSEGRENGVMPTGIIGIQLMNTNQDLTTSTLLNLSYAHQISINEKATLAMSLGAGKHSFGYDDNALIYFDAQDDLLDRGDNFMNFHMNIGFAFQYDQKYFVNFALPNAVGDNDIDLSEILLRAGYIHQINESLKLVAAANLDTNNDVFTYGGDMELELQKTISVIVGANKFKYYGGIIAKVKMVSLAYSYGRNYDPTFDHMQSHQISLTSGF